jgi:hypothetical protein
MKKKADHKRNYSGLTVNERLALSGLWKKFDAAARVRNRDAMIALLRKVALTEQYAALWVDTLLGDSTFFYR